MALTDLNCTLGWRSANFGVMSTKVSLLAKLTVAEGRADDLKSALDALISAADEEDGLEVYSAHADNSDPSVFWFFEVYRDQEALTVHGKGEKMKAAMRTLGGCLDGRPEVTMLSPLAAKGLDL